VIKEDYISLKIFNNQNLNDLKIFIRILKFLPFKYRKYLYGYKSLYDLLERKINSLSIDMNTEIYIKRICKQQFNINDILEAINDMTNEQDETQFDFDWLKDLSFNDRQSILKVIENRKDCPIIRDILSNYKIELSDQLDNIDYFTSLLNSNYNSNQISSDNIDIDETNFNQSLSKDIDEINFTFKIISKKFIGEYPYRWGVN